MSRRSRFSSGEASKFFSAQQKIYERRRDYFIRKYDFKAAGLPEGMWNRDFRAGGITEGGKAGASKDDRRKLAGHAKEETTEIYDRDQVEAHRRVMQARKQFREQNGQ